MENEQEVACTKCGDPIFYTLFGEAPDPQMDYGYYALAGYHIPTGVRIVDGVDLCTPCARIINVGGA